MFDLRFESALRIDDMSWRHALGRITLGDFAESFEADLESWSATMYERHWTATARRLLEGADRVLFVTSYRGLGALYHFGWPAWRDGSRVILRSWLILTEELGGSFDPIEGDHHVRDRGVRRRHDDPFPEWEVELDDLRAFVERTSRPSARRESWE